MKRMKINTPLTTFSDGCDMYLTYCKQRNLREGTINHYKQSYNQFFKYFDYDMPLDKFTKDKFDGYILYLRKHLNNDVSINSYLRDLITVLHYLMDNEYIKPFKMHGIKADKSPTETYTDEELKTLLKKPNIKRCSFVEYQSWVISSLLFSTGIRQHSLMELKVSDIDTDECLLHVGVTKSRKPLIIPLNQSMTNILKEFINIRNPKSNNDWLFCNCYGDKLKKSTSYHMLYTYNKNRGIETTGLHRYRHTFAKQWILNGGNVVTLSRLLGHSNLQITQNYINLLVSDMSKQVDEMNLLDKFSGNTFIKTKK